MNIEVLSAQRGQLLWLDLETTGLHPKANEIIEVGAIVTRDDPGLTEIANFHAFVVPPIPDAGTWTPEAFEMHRQSGLIQQGRLYGSDLTTAESELEGFVMACCDERPWLAGASIGFDRSFLDAWMPRVSKLLHYRVFDATTLRGLRNIAAGEGIAGLTTSQHHRAMDDLRDSLSAARETLRTYRLGAEELENYS